MPARPGPRTLARTSCARVGASADRGWSWSTSVVHVRQALLIAGQQRSRSQGAGVRTAPRTSPRHPGPEAQAHVTSEAQAGASTHRSLACPSAPPRAPSDPAAPAHRLHPRPVTHPTTRLREPRRQPGLRTSAAKILSSGRPWRGLAPRRHGATVKRWPWRCAARSVPSSVRRPRCRRREPPPTFSESAAVAVGSRESALEMAARFSHPLLRVPPPLRHASPFAPVRSRFLIGSKRPAGVLSRAACVPSGVLTPVR